MRADLPGGGQVSGVIGTVGANGALIFYSMTQAINETTQKIESAIANQKHANAGEFPTLTVHFRNGATAMMPPEVYLNKDGQPFDRAGSAKSIREWIEQNRPPGLTGRLSVAIYAHVTAIWHELDTP